LILLEIYKKTATRKQPNNRQVSKIKLEALDLYS